ncbi:hypothetical protein SDRG_06126 [Saprolegnia diclina VS20]|uniref:Uncharacterized protein n=1 Tax=Saprolegnia diclina (strain VS20) TaxID=1156394 RepID=T0S1U6_SAPDV|nr:hypothetical protein SDRG_06126 [Saprolegnia diclina VS20]EQC36692.1 hypothetical protein SDRG_06126 [Saprolegnia diclina VS20]|eukprot:XP_008610113.1 hypothetical protein SDRG_06126 [Saprolegnia diclina VS20]
MHSTKYYSASWLQTAENTKNHMLMVCLAILHSMDHIQERFGVSSDVVQDAKRHLHQLLHFDIASTSLPSISEAWTAKVNSCDIWASDAGGFIAWLIDTIKWISDFVHAAYDHIYSCAQAIPYVPTACAQLGKIYDCCMSSSPPDSPTSAMSFPSSIHEPPMTPYQDTFLAIVLEYREKDDNLMSKRMRRMMHFTMSARPFEATVQLPPVPRHELLANSQAIYNTGLTPQSIPASPRARAQMTASLSSFSTDLLYHARDQLRQERAAMLQGKQRDDIIVPNFNHQDCAPEIQLSCGGHCATKIHQGLYRTVRANVAIPIEKALYFEMSIVQAPSLITSCIGLSSPATLPLNALVGTQKHSIGLFSSGTILAPSLQVTPIESLVATGSSTIGVLLYRYPDTPSMHIVQVQFGKLTPRSIAVSGMCELRVPAEIELFPTLSLHSTQVPVLGRFSPCDFVCSMDGLQAFDLTADYHTIYGLDGSVWSSQSSSSTLPSPLPVDV